MCLCYGAFAYTKYHHFAAPRGSAESAPRERPLGAGVYIEATVADFVISLLTN